MPMDRQQKESIAKNIDNCRLSAWNEVSRQKLGKYVKGLLSVKSRRQALFLCLDTAKYNNDITQRKMPNVLPEGMNHEEVRILR